MASSSKKGILGQDVDMFGDPIGAVRDRWGRKSFAKTKENQEFVCLLVLSGYSQEDIAEEIGCDPKTLRKHFSRELSEGKRRLKTKLLQITLSNAKKGNNAAIAKLLKMSEGPTRPGSVRKSASHPSAPQVAKLGKKDSQMLKAKAAPKDWAETLPEYTVN